MSQPIYCSPHIRPWTVECDHWAEELKRTGRSMVWVPQLANQVASEGWFQCRS